MGQVSLSKAGQFYISANIIASQGYTAQLGGETRYTHRPEGRQLYFAYDALGSVASLANYAGQARERYQYLAFGSLVAGDVAANAHTFTGREFDPESGLYHFHFRKYDQVTGVWVSPDSLGILEGPNFYRYANNSPVVYIDELGQFVKFAFGQIGKRIGIKLSEEEIMSDKEEKSLLDRHMRMATYTHHRSDKKH